MDNRSSILAWVLFFAPTYMDDYVKARKSFSQDLLYTSVLSYSDVTDIAKRGLYYDVHSLVIMHSNGSEFDKSGLIKISKEVDISLFKWLLITNKYDPEEYEHVKIPFNCQFVIAERSESGEYAISEIYDTLAASKVIKHLGKWSPDNGFETDGSGFFTRRWDLSNNIFNISSNHEDPCSTHSFAGVAGSVLKCIHYRSFHILARMHNFSINWVVMNRSGGFGLEVLTPEFQFSLFEISEDNYDSITVLWPTMRVPLEIYTSYAGQGLGWSTFIHPFSKEMWSAIVLWFLASAAFVSVAELVFLNVGKTERRRMFLRLWLGYVFSSYSAFCNQSEGGDPDKLSLRILVYLIFLIPTVLVPGYSAALTSFIAIKLEWMPFTNLEGLSKAKDYKLIFQASFDLSVFFDEDSPDEAVRTIVRDIVAPKDELPGTESEGINKICEGKYSFLCSQFSIVAVPPPCPYFKLERPAIIAFIFLPVRLDFPYKNLIDRSYRQLLYRGIVAKESTRILPVTMNSDYPIEQNQEEELSPILFENVVTIFMGLGLGLFVSVAIVLAEIIHFRRAKFLSLKAELLKKRQEVRDAKLSEFPNKPTVVKKVKTKLDKVNEGVDERNSRDLEEIEEENNVLQKSKRALEAKSKLYDELSKNPESAARVGNILVDFSNKEKENEEVDTAADEAGDESTAGEYDEDEDEWVDFVDCLGRTKRCHKDDLESMKISDDKLRLSLFGKSAAKERRDDSPRKEEKEMLGQPDLCSDDMRRKMLREKWEEQERQLADRRDIHYQHVLFDEARTHGVGYYHFSTDEDERARQLKDLEDLRKHTLEQQTVAKEALRRRQKHMNERLRVARRRKRERLGLPLEMDTEEPEEVEEETPKPEELKREEKTSTTTRIWDLGKKPATKTYTQDEWIEMRRAERPREFAPPQSHESSRQARKRKQEERYYPEPYLEDISSSPKEFAPTQFLETTRPTRKKKQEERYYPEPYLEDISSSPKYTEDQGTSYEGERGAGAEIPPPPTFELYGSSSRQADHCVITPDIERSIEEGLNFIRRQVEERKMRERKFSSDSH